MSPFEKNQKKESSILSQIPLSEKPFFQTQVPGKWILAGEHAVLRGAPALVFPLYSRLLTFRHYLLDEKTRPSSLELHLSGEFGSELEVLFWGVFAKACELTQIKKENLTGCIYIESQIPIGAGLGASASLSVAISLWFQALGHIRESELLEFARHLENLFHGESSGVDIAVVLSKKGLRFLREGERRVFQPQWRPSLYLSYCGNRGGTFDCVKKVKNLFNQNFELASELDKNMINSVELAEKALLLSNKAEESLDLLVQAMTMAKLCFDKWKLSEGELSQHMNLLLETGALAVKPTGSGGGGYVLSLWKNSPPTNMLPLFISCF